MVESPERVHYCQGYGSAWVGALVVGLAVAALAPRLANHLPPTAAVLLGVVVCASPALLVFRWGQVLMVTVWSDRAVVHRWLWPGAVLRRGGTQTHSSGDGAWALTADGHKVLLPEQLIDLRGLVVWLTVQTVEAHQHTDVQVQEAVRAQWPALVDDVVCLASWRHAFLIAVSRVLPIGGTCTATWVLSVTAAQGADRGYLVLGVSAVVCAMCLLRHAVVRPRRTLVRASVTGLRLDGVFGEQCVVAWTKVNATGTNMLQVDGFEICLADTAEGRLVAQTAGVAAQARGAKCQACAPTAPRWQ